MYLHLFPLIMPWPGQWSDHLPFRKWKSNHFYRRYKLHSSQNYNGRMTYLWMNPCFLKMQKNCENWGIFRISRSILVNTKQNQGKLNWTRWKNRNFEIQTRNFVKAREWKFHNFIISSYLTCLWVNLKYIRWRISNKIDLVNL